MSDKKQQKDKLISMYECGFGNYREIATHLNMIFDETYWDSERVRDMG